MNRVERRVRDLINPYSTAFASWWCYSARYWRLPRAITGNKTAARPGLPRLAVPRVTGGASEGSGFPVLSVFPAGAEP
jgi:hypothetical protein